MKLDEETAKTVIVNKGRRGPLLVRKKRLWSWEENEEEEEEEELEATRASERQIA